MPDLPAAARRSHAGLALPGRGRRHTRLPLTGYMTLNSGEGLVAAARAGLGIIQVADYYARAGLAGGQLVELLPEWKTAGHHISAAYYRRRAVTKVRAFVDFLVALFSRPEWNGTVPAVRRRTKKARRPIRCVRPARPAKHVSAAFLHFHATPSR